MQEEEIRSVLEAAQLREREIARLSRLYAALVQVNTAIVGARARDELLPRICRILVEHGKFAMSWIGWHDPATHRISPVASHGDDTHYLDSIAIYGDDRPEGRGPTGKAFRDGRAYVSNDLLNDPASQPWRSALAPRAFRAAAVFPVREGGHVRGTLSVYAEEVGCFRDAEVALLGEAANTISFALDNLARDEARRHAEATLRQERDFSDAMLRSLPGVLYLYDETGRFLRWNENFERVTGYTGAEIAGMQPRDFFQDSEHPLIAARIAEVFATGETSVEAELLAKDGTRTRYHLTGVRTLLDGRPCLIGVGIDISTRERAEAALRELNESLELKVVERTAELQAALVRAEAADRLKSAFLATMSHELRTPLNSILGFTGILLQHMAGPLNAEQDKQLGMVRTSARHLLELINDVLDLSKIEAGQLEVHFASFDLPASIERVLGTVSPLASAKHLVVTAAVAPELREVVSDRRRVEQILLNLVNNAIKFTEQGSVHVSAARANGHVSICVADTGIGIKPEDVASLFQPFRQLDTGLTRHHEGTGLGLAICRRLATLLGGEITVRSTWQRGSELTLSLPETR